MIAHNVSSSTTQDRLQCDMHLQRAHKNPFLLLRWLYLRCFLDNISLLSVIPKANDSAYNIFTTEFSCGSPIVIVKNAYRSNELH